MRSGVNDPVSATLLLIIQQKEERNAKLAIHANAKSKIIPSINISVLST